MYALDPSRRDRCGTATRDGFETTRHRERPPILDALAVPLEFGRGQRIYVRGDPSLYWYRVVSGLARKCALTADGRQQIVEFLLPDDFFGCNGQDRHEFTVEAVTDGTSIARYPRRHIERIAETDPRVGSALRDIALDIVRRVQSRILLLGRTSAAEKVGAFLVEMAERSPDGTAETVILRMSRYDIADYLALSVETVSRTLTELKQSGAIQLEAKHRVRLVDLHALARAATASDPPNDPYELPGN